MKSRQLVNVLQDLEQIVKSLDLVSLQEPDLSNMGISLNRGKPTPDQLDKINQMTGRDSKAEEWYVIPFKASDNLVSRSMRQWHGDVLNQMTDQLKGRPLIVDHNWDNVGDSVGHIFDCVMTNATSAPQSVWDQPGKADLNRAIIAKEGYKAVYCLACVGSDMQNVIDGIESRRLNDCSTGGLLSNIQMLCPNCSDDKGREVSFTEKNKNGEYTCPHMIPSQYSGMYSSDDDDPDVDDLGQTRYADYMTLNGVFDGIELSIVQAGNLPAASVVR
jgi:hypothetical protein